MLISACGNDVEIVEAGALPALVPIPLVAKFQDGVYRLSDVPIVTVPDDEEIASATTWIAGQISANTGVALTVRQDARGQSGISLEIADAQSIRDEFAAHGVDVLDLPDEAYVVSVGEHGVQARATTAAGLFYAMTTVSQMVSGDTSHPGTIRFASILDAPEFAWRGLMLDSARHMQSPQFIKQYIDWMALYKLNILHWHLTDDQGWRLQIESYPRLTDIGAWRVPAGDAPGEDIDAATNKPPSSSTISWLGSTMAPSTCVPGSAQAGADWSLQAPGSRSSM
jgi:hexosaminidase